MAGIGKKKIEPVGGDRPAHILLIENLQPYGYAGFPGQVVRQRLVTFLKHTVRPIGEYTHSQCFIGTG